MQNTQHTLQYDDPKTIRTETELSAKEFKDFKLFLNIIKSNFKDFSLTGGAFRTHSNNRKCIVETGFGFFSDMHFDIPNIKSFVRLISKFDKKTTITVRTDDTGITIADYLGEIQISSPNPEYIDNKFVSDKDMEEIVLKNVDPNKLIVSEGIPKINVRRMNMISRKLYSDCISFKHDKNDLTKGFLSISGRSDNSSELQVELKKPLIIPFRENHYFNLAILPTLFNKDDMYLKCYFTNDEKILSIFSTKVNDLFVNIYSKSELIEESEEG